MSGSEFEKTACEERRRVVEAKLFETLAGSVFRLDHVERSRGEEDWLCRLSAFREGTLVRRVSITVRTPTPFPFDVSISWDLVGLCAMWVTYGGAGGPYRFSRNTKRIVGEDG